LAEPPSSAGVDARQRLGKCGAQAIEDLAHLIAVDAVAPDPIAQIGSSSEQA
jgi:hypothetical protein